MWIAFKLFNFDTLKTALGVTICGGEVLWIAFKLFNFDTLKTAWGQQGQDRCALWIAFKLFNFDTLKTAEQRNYQKNERLWIAFKLFNFDTLKTARRDYTARPASLWIAFKLFNFDTLKTANIKNIKELRCCELLSNFLTLILWKQQSLSNKLIHNYLMAVFRIKNPIFLSDFFCCLYSHFTIRTIRAGQNQ